MHQLTMAIVTFIYRHCFFCTWVFVGDAESTNAKVRHFFTSKQNQFPKTDNGKIWGSLIVFHNTPDYMKLLQGDAMLPNDRQKVVIKTVIPMSDCEIKFE